MKKFSILLNIILLIIIGFGIYKFVLQGSTQKSVDGRTAILLNSSEKDLILAEMRAFLASTQQIVAAVSNDELSQAVIAAKKSGRAAQAEVPTSLVGKLPLAFKKLGFATHTKFDELAQDAQDMEDKEQTLKLLAELMQNCVACHSTYRLELEHK